MEIMEALQKTTQKTQTTLFLPLRDKQILKCELARSIEHEGIATIADKLSGQTNLLYMKLQQNVTMERIFTEPQKSLQQIILEGNLDALQKVICVSVKYFSDSLQIARKMSALDYLDFSFLFIERYPHESVEDLILALKFAKTEGRIIYNAFDTQILFQIFNEYQEKKALEREYRHKKAKNTPAQNILQLMNESENEKIRSFVDLLKDKQFGIAKPIEGVKTRSLDEELNNLKKLFSGKKVSIDDCLEFQEHCKVHGLTPQYDLITEIINQKNK